MTACNGTQQWHNVHSTKVGRHPASNHSTLQWHTSTAPCNGTQQWHHVHSTIAHYNGTLQWHPAMAPRPLNHSTLQWHPAMAPSNGTTSTAPCNGILVPRPMRKSGSSPSPPIGSKNPYSYRYPGKNFQLFQASSLNRSQGVFFFSNLPLPRVVPPSSNLPPRWVQPGPRKKVSSKGRIRSARCNCCQVLSFSDVAVLRRRRFAGGWGDFSRNLLGKLRKSNQKYGGVGCRYDDISSNFWFEDHQPSTSSNKL